MMNVSHTNSTARSLSCSVSSAMSRAAANVYLMQQIAFASLTGAPVQCKDCYRHCGVTFEQVVDLWKLLDSTSVPLNLLNEEHAADSIDSSLVWRRKCTDAMYAKMLKASGIKYIATRHNSITSPCASPWRHRSHARK
jgi:hypothetical protein